MEHRSRHEIKTEKNGENSDFHFVKTSEIFQDSSKFVSKFQICIRRYSITDSTVYEMCHYELEYQILSKKMLSKYTRRETTKTTWY